MDNIVTLNVISLDGGRIIRKGGGGDMPLQSKVVDITENGTTEVLPDSGMALSKVTVNVEVSGGGTENSIEYLDVSSLKDNIKEHLILCSRSVKSISKMRFFAAPFLLEGGKADDVLSIEIDMAAIYLAMSYYTATVKEWLLDKFTQQELEAIPRLTKEQFYSFE
jgi:hypothetical protein